MSASTLLADGNEHKYSLTQNQWTPSSWRQKKAKQQPVYADQIKYEKAHEKLETLPPLVTEPEVGTLPSSLLTIDTSST